ncbi:glycosyltransferase family A protein [Synechococcus sp. A15-28]|uniref:glycosyltransferase family 2 protein n=1 Tax=Synechococcus sp. A15-28 TaxID=1050638 RepID=UPI0016497286|nr:glycosyltransferase family A protein [Synechococcus sp. A15-28]QNI41137.1 putative beta-glycosyltransferase/ family 2 [Synechococcus sp. A15-28]
MPWTPAVSFLIPARNRPEELKAALASCLAQSCDAWEAVVVDDHSDNADLLALVAAFDDSRLRYYRLPDGERGVSAARNQAVALARSPRLLTFDSDDLNHPHRAARCRELLDPDHPQLIYTRVRLFSATHPSGSPKQVLQPFTAALLEMINFITNPGTAFTVKAFEAAGDGFRPSLSLAEDYDLYLRMARAGVTIRAIDEEHVSYRKHPKATTNRRQAELHEAVMTVRRLNGVKPFPIEAIRSHSLPELARNLLDNPDQRALWQDDRWNDA